MTPNKREVPRPPKHLAAAGKGLWAQLHEAYVVEDADDLQLLGDLCCMSDRIADCRAQLAKEGLTVRDRYGVPKAHPACDIERSAIRTAMQLIRQLGLGEAADELVRLPRLKGRH